MKPSRRPSRLLRRLKHYPSLRRRTKTIPCWCGQRAEDIIADITTMLDMVMTQCYTPSVKVTEHPVERQMRQRLHHEVERAGQIKKRMEALASAYNEFLDLRGEYASRKARTSVLYGLIGDDVHATYPNVTETAAAQLAGGSDKSLRGQLPLWEAMREYLHYVPEARIGEMEEFFSHLGYDEGNRQAIESALKRHPKEFHVRNPKKWEKYISLKKQP